VGGINKDKAGVFRKPDRTPSMATLVFARHAVRHELLSARERNGSLGRLIRITLNVDISYAVRKKAQATQDRHAQAKETTSQESSQEEVVAIDRDA
jgi:hypothetical protein